MAPFWSLPAMVGNAFMPIRTVFAWAFDRLLPEKFSEVKGVDVDLVYREMPPE